MERIKKYGRYISPVILGLSLCSFFKPVSAVVLPPNTPDGACWGDRNLDAVFEPVTRVPSNTVGSVIKVIFRGTPNTYTGHCYSTTSTPKVATLYSSRTDYYTPGLIDGYFKLSNELDFQTGIDIGILNITAPFKNRVDSSDNSGPTGMGITTMAPATTATTGYLRLRLRKELIGGALYLPAGVEIGNIHRYTYWDMDAERPLYRLLSHSLNIALPVVCSINNGSTINVPFGNIDQSIVTENFAASPYKIDKSLTYNCSSTLNQDIKVNLAADSAGFADAIKTSHDDIGVVMTHKGAPVAPNDGFVSRLVNGQGEDQVSFIAVKRPGSLPEVKSFTGSATLIITSL